jgi:hypothetical protein
VAIVFGDNLQFSGKKPDFVRQEYATFADMKAVKKSNMPEIYFAYCLEDRNFYKYDKTVDVDPVLGNFRLFTAGSQSQMEEMPEAGEAYVGKVIQYVGETDTDFTKGYFYTTVYEDVTETKPVETVEKLTELINGSDRTINIKNPDGTYSEVKAYTNDDSTWYFIQDDVVYAGTPVDRAVETMAELTGLIEASDEVGTVRLSDCTEVQGVQMYSNDGKKYFVQDDVLYSGVEIPVVCDTVAGLKELINDSEQTVTIRYNDGTEETVKCYSYEGTDYFVSGGVIHGGVPAEGVVVFDDTTTYPTDSDVAALNIITERVVVLDDSTAYVSDEEVAAANIIWGKASDFDPAVNPSYTTDEAVAALGLTYDETTRDYTWENVPVSPSEGEPDSIPIEEIDELFD